MSDDPTEFEKMLREALAQAVANAPQAKEDLIGLASEAGDAVKKVTEGAATVELVPIDVTDDPRPTYQLQFLRLDSESPRSDLGVFRLSASGYPIQRWASKGAWESNPESPEREHLNVGALRGNFKFMLSKPDTRLVILINHLRVMKGIK
jgi:hypothetical protein